MQRVFLGPTEITDFVIDWPRVVSQTSEIGQVAIADIPSLTGDNTRNFWEVENPSSPFYGADLRESEITLFQDGALVFDGAIQNIRVDESGHTAEVLLRSRAQKALDDGIIYVSGQTTPLEKGTPADLAIEICELYNIQWDAGSFALSNAYYNFAELEVRGRIIAPGTTLLAALQALATIGTARVWFEANILYWQAWQPGGAPPIVEFNDDIEAVECTLLSRPTPEQIEKQEVRGYSVTWEGGPPAEIGLQDGAFTVDGGPQSIFPIATLSSAVWVGGQWLAYLSRPQNRITFNVPIGYARELKLGDPVAVRNFSGRWAEARVIDITMLDTSTLVQGTISGVTRVDLGEEPLSA